MTDRPTLVISLAARPGVFGQTVHTAGYKALGLNYQYKPMQGADLPMVLNSVRNLGIRGCSLTMPFKVQALKYLDELSPLVRAVGAVNTVVNENGKLIGHNTDVLGAKDLLNGYQYLPWLVLGAGGMARAFLQVARELQVPEAYISCRDPEQGQELVNKFGAKFMPWLNRHNFSGHAVLNATPIGMAPDDHDMPIELEDISKASLIFDAVPKPAETKLIRAAHKAKVPVVITGRDLALAQAYAQFELYTGQAAPRQAMAEAAKTVP